MKSFLLASLMAMVCMTGALGKSNPKGESDLKVTVIKSENGKPVRNASVVLHEVDEKGVQKSGGLQLKTDADGQASYSGFPYGKLRIQVLARGYQTFGSDYDISQPLQEIEIKLNPPQRQYSIYEEHPEQQKKE